MKILICGITILIFIFIEYIIYNLYTTLFMIAGLTKRKARLQTLSLLTMCGYSTKESEDVVNYTVRRKIAIACMMTGYIMSTMITIVVMCVVAGLDFSTVDNHYMRNALFVLGIVVVAMFVLFIISRIKPVRKLMFSIVHKIMLGKKAKHYNVVVFGDKICGKQFARVYLNYVPSILRDKQIKDIKFNKIGIKILGIRDENIGATIDTDEILFKPGQMVELLGDQTTIRKLFWEIK